MATAKKPVSRTAAKKAPAKKVSVQSRKPVQSTALARRPAYNDMLGDESAEIVEVDESRISKSNMPTYSDQPAMDSSDLFIPRLRLAQGLTQEVQSGEAKPGQWLVLGMEPMDEVDVIPMGMTRRRELRDPDTRSVACRSGDGVTGVGNPGGDCASCPMAEWTQPAKKGGKNRAPACSFMYSYLVYVVEIGQMAILEFSRTSITTGKMINTMVMQRGIGTFAIRLDSVSKQGPAGSYYSPTVSASSVKPDVLKKAVAEAHAVN